MIGRDARPSEEHIRRSKEIAGLLIPVLREVARRHGYALAVHGSLERDIDLLAAPWRELATDADSLVRDIYAVCVAVFGFATGPGGWTEKETFDPPVGSLPNPERKPYGRLGWSIILGGGPYIDLSVMPKEPGTPAPPASPSRAPGRRASARSSGSGSPGRR